MGTGCWPGMVPGIQFAHENFPQPGDRMRTPSDWAWAGGAAQRAAASEPDARRARGLVAGAKVRCRHGLQDHG